MLDNFMNDRIGSHRFHLVGPPGIRSNEGARGSGRESEQVSKMLAHSDFLSMDVFDTVLTRACGAPEALYLWLGRRLQMKGWIDCSPEAFARVRARAEQAVWFRAGGMDGQVRVEDFYLETLRRLGLPEDRVADFTRLELELEAEVLKGVPGALDLVNRAAAAKKNVLFVTDTYFPAAFVEEQLKKAGVWTSNTRCFASTELGASKATGRLYDHLLSVLGCPKESICHVGDNPHSDLKMAASRGIRNAWFPAARLNRYEQRLCDLRWETGGLSAAIAGAGRLARLSVPASSPHDAALRDVAASVASPILIGFILWVLLRARDLGLKQLYFCARDGQIMVELARRLVVKLELDIEISYLLLSRKSVNLAATYSMEDEEIAWVFRDIPSLTLREFLERFDLRWDDIPSLAEGMRSEPDAPASQLDARELKQLLGTEAVRKLILERAAARRALVRKYLDQEGVFDAAPCGLIDFGGVGSQMRALHAIASEGGSPEPALFLMGLDSIKGLYQESLDIARNTPWIMKTECYLYDHRREQGIKRRRGFGTCVQMFCAADHGTISGYEDHGGVARAVINDPVDHAMLDWGLPVVRKTIGAVIDHLVLDHDLVDVKGDLRSCSCEVINMFWTAPDMEEARAWGRFPLEGAEASGSAGQALAWRYTWASVVRGTLKGSFPNLGWQHWFEGSLRLSSPPLRMVLSHAKSLYQGDGARRGLRDTWIGAAALRARKALKKRRKN